MQFIKLLSKMLRNKLTCNSAIKAEMFASPVSPNETGKIITFLNKFPENSPNLPLIKQTDCLTPNSCHWLSRCCAELFIISKQTEKRFESFTGQLFLKLRWHGSTILYYDIYQCKTDYWKRIKYRAGTWFYVSVVDLIFRCGHCT